jgi:MFS family permease
VSAPVEVVSQTSAPEVPLRRNWQFQTLWIGSSFSFLGIEILSSTFPLAILLTTGSAVLAGLFGVVQMSTFALLALPAGSVVDRYNPRRVLLMAETTQMIMASSVAVALGLDRLTHPHIVAAAVTFGGALPFMGAARTVLVRAIVPSSQMTAALAQEELRSSTVGLVGPPLGGFLAGLSLAMPFAAAAITAALSWCSGLIVRPLNRVSRAAAGSRSMFSGLRRISTDPTLRAVMGQMSMINIAAAPIPLLLVVILIDQGATPFAIGAALGGNAVGALAGTALVRPLLRLRPGTLFTVVPTTLAFVLACLALPWGVVWIGAVLFVSMLGIPALRVALDVIVLGSVPDEHRGRVVGALMLILSVTYPVGLGAATVLIHVSSATVALLVLLFGFFVGALLLATFSALREARWPADEPGGHAR